MNNKLNAILESTLISTANEDKTSNLRLQIENLLKNSTLEGSPTIFNFVITHTNNEHATSRNTLLSLNIPILPVTLGSSTKEQVERLLNPKTNKDSLISDAKALDPEVLENKIKAQASLILLKIKLKIHDCYIDAKASQNDKAVKILKNLDASKGLVFKNSTTEIFSPELQEKYNKMCREHNNDNIMSDLMSESNNLIFTALKKYNDKIMSQNASYETNAPSQE